MVSLPAPPVMVSLPAPPVSQSSKAEPVRAVALPILVTWKPAPPGAVTAARFTANPLVVMLAVPRLVVAAEAVQVAVVVAFTVAPAATVRMSAPPMPRSVMRSVPAVMAKLSIPALPVRVSSPAPPVRVLAPAFPMSVMAADCAEASMLLAVVALVVALRPVPVPSTAFSMPVSLAKRVRVLAVVAAKRSSSVPVVPVSANSPAVWSLALRTM